MKVGIALFVLSAMGAMGCGSRQHVRDEHGIATRRVFSAQAVRKKPAEAAADKPLGLHPDEARIVYENYRASLIAKENQRMPLAPGAAGLIVVEERDENEVTGKKRALRE